ncbi:hypothetical protein IWX75_002832 [Arthrobacter sp. CAN_A6]
MTDAFSFGCPGRQSVALPCKIVGLLQRPGAADGVLRHEFAHIRHGDVELAWLARSVWFVAAPLLAVPVVWQLTTGNFSSVLDYTWRAVLLAVVVDLVAANVLRSREYEADLRAGAGVGEFRQINQAIDLIALRAPRSWVRRVRGRHPGADQRREVVNSPHLAAGTGFLEALSTGFLTATIIPLLMGTVSSLFWSTGTLLSFGFAASVAGPLLALTVGLSLWRSHVTFGAMDSTGVGPRLNPPVLPVAMGVGIGLAAGQMASLSMLGSPFAGMQNASSLVVAAFIGAGAVGMADSICAVCAPVVRLARRPVQAWLPVLAVNVALFAVAIWTSYTVQQIFDAIGWQVLLVIPFLLNDGYLLAGTVFIVAVTFIAAARARECRNRAYPSWMYFPQEGPPASPFEQRPVGRGEIKFLPSVATGALIGALCTGTVIAGWLWFDPASSNVDGVAASFAIPMLASSVWFLVNLGTAVRHPRTGAATGLLSGVTAGMVIVVGLTIFFSVLASVSPSGTLPATLSSYFGVGILFALLASSVALVIRPRLSGKQPPGGRRFGNRGKR